MQKRLSGLLALTVVLAACGQPTTGSGSNGSGTGIQVNSTGSFVVSGNVVFKSALASADVASSQSLSPQAALSAINWDALRSRGVLLLSGGNFSAQGVGPLAGLSVERLDADLSLVRTPAGEDDRAFAQRLAAAGYVVQPNYVYKAQTNDPGYPGGNGVPVDNAPPPYNQPQYNLFLQDYLSSIKATDAFDYLQSAKPSALAGVKVAVLDTGINAGHEDLQGRVAGGGKDFCVTAVLSADGNSVTCQGEDNDPSEVAKGDVGHGTSSAGLIGAATNNNKGIAGMTWSGANILPIKVIGPASDGQSYTDTVAIRKGVQYAVSQGAKVINMSLGAPGISDQALAQALAQAAQSAVLVASAGNTPNQGIYYPASDGNVIAVGAIKADLSGLTCYSARPSGSQKSLDLVAPGGDAEVNGQCYQRSVNDILTLGVGNSAYTLRAGTSEAAPLVSGAAALVFGANPSLSASQVRGILKSNFALKGGQRLLDVNAAVRAAIGTGGGTTPPPPPMAQTYNVYLAVYQGNNKLGEGQDTVQSGATNLPYSAQLPAGQYTLKATVSLNGTQVQSGQTTVNVSGNTTANIQTQ